MSSVKYLKVKIKSLASEAQIIRKEEHKTKRSYRYYKGRQGHEASYEKALEEFWGLRTHRKGVVAQEARDSLLAYAFIRGQRYRTAENNGEPILRFYWDYAKKANLPIYAMNLENIARLATKYGNEPVDAYDIEKWVLVEELQEMTDAAE